MAITLSSIIGARGTDTNYLLANNNLSDVTSASSSLTNLGITSTAAELNKLDGVTTTTAQFNYLNTATSNIQTQLNTKVGSLSDLGVTASAAELNILDGVTATASELNILDGVTASAAELNILDGVTASAAELNILDGVTASTAELNYNDITTLGTSQASKVVTADANGDVNLSEELIAKSYNETLVALSGTTPTINCESGNIFTLTTSGNTTFTFSNPPSSGTAYAFTLKVTSGGSHTLTWPASVDWPSGVAPVAPESGDVDVYIFLTHDAGTTWYGFQAGDALA